MYPYGPTLCDFYFPCLSHLCSAVKRRLFVKLDLYETKQSPGLRETKMAALPKRQNGISNISVPFLLCKPTEVVSSSHHHLCTKFELWVSKTTKIGVLKFWMQQELQATDANHASNVVNQPVFLGEVQQAAGLKVKI